MTANRNSSYAEAVAGAIRAEVARRGMTVSDTARKAGMSRQSLHAKLDGASKLSYSDVERVAEALGTTIQVIHESAMLGREAAAGGAAA